MWTESLPSWGLHLNSLLPNESSLQLFLFFLSQKKLEDAKSQAQVLGLDKELKKLKKAVAASDKMATAELTIAKDQLKSLHGTVMKINQERAEVSPHAQSKCPPRLPLSEHLATCVFDLSL